MSVWNKDLSGYVWPWLEPLFGAFLAYHGIKTIYLHEYRDRTWVYHGLAADFAGVLMLLGAVLLFRGRIWRTRGLENWTILDKVLGVIVGAGFLFSVVVKWVAIL